MRTPTLVLLTSLLFSSLSIYSPQESPELKEASDLSASMAKLFTEKKFDEAIPLAKRALELRERLLPANDPLVSRSFSNLGEVYLAKGDYSAAKKIFERLLALQEQQFGPADFKLASTLDRLAVLYYREGSATKAEDMYERALAVREKALGPDSIQVADSLFALGQLYRLRSKYDLALDAYKRSLLIYGRRSGVTAPGFERARTGISCVAYESGKKAIFKDIDALQEQFAPHMDLQAPLDVLNGKAISLPKPEYPMDARRLRLYGIVMVRVEIDEKGRVLSARDMCLGPPFLSEAAIQSALKARFTPTLVSGQPVKVSGVIQYNFVAR